MEPVLGIWSSRCDPGAQWMSGAGKSKRKEPREHQRVRAGGESEWGAKKDAMRAEVKEKRLESTGKPPKIISCSNATVESGKEQAQTAWIWQLEVFSSELSERKYFGQSYFFTFPLCCAFTYIYSTNVNN